LSDSRSRRTRGHSHHVSATQLWSIGAAVAVAVVVVLGGLALRRQLSHAPAAAAQSASAWAAVGSSDAGSIADLGALGQLDDWRGAKDLSAAIEATRSHMTDTIDRLDEGSAELALWASQHLAWNALSALPETSSALYRKDPEAERGKRLCARGTITVVRAERNLARRLQSDHPLPLPAPATPEAGSTNVDAGLLIDVGSSSQWDVPGGKVFFAIVDAADPEAKDARPAPDGPPPLVVSVIAAGSSGQLVDGDSARVCGVLTGVNLIKDGARTDTLAHRVVGMFDLPENRAKR